MINYVRRFCAISAFMLLLTCLAFADSGASSNLGQSQIDIPTTIPAAAQASDHFDVDAATEAYLAEMPTSAQSRSNAYFEGGYWLILWDFLYGAVVALVLLNLRWSAAMRNLAERIEQRTAKWLPLVLYWAFGAVIDLVLIGLTLRLFRAGSRGLAVVALLAVLTFSFVWLRFAGPIKRFLARTVGDFSYWVQYMIFVTVLTAPLAIYEGYIREHQYGLANQTFGPWLGDQMKDLAINVVLGGVLVVVLFAIVRKLPRTWWVWGAVVTILLLTFTIMIGPVYLQPMFNKITRLDDPKITQPILSLARANGIPAHDVYEIDASKQTTRMSANVSGFGQTMRITLNDNLLRRGSLEEIEAVMGHEMGHYVLNHVPKTILFLLIVVTCFFAFLHWSLDWSLARWGEKWQIRGIGDPAVLPLVVLLFSLFFFVLTPIMNTHIRSEEAEADMFGLNASRQPDGFARAALHLGEYRKMRPGPIEEIIFYDHPSGYNRIHRAMQWKKENLSLFQPAECPAATNAGASSVPSQ